MLRRDGHPRDRARRWMLAGLGGLSGIVLGAGPTAGCPFHTMIDLVEKGEAATVPSAALNQWFDEMVREERAVRDQPVAPVVVPVAKDAHQVGRWRPPIRWLTNAIHAMLLPSGDVLHYYYQGAEPGARGKVWHPETETFSDADWQLDVMCSGHSFLPDGKLYVTGGNGAAGCGFQGQVWTHTFDWRNRQWTRLGDMNRARWYPTNVNLGDGRILILSGLDLACQITEEMEMFTPGQGLSEVPGGRKRLEIYPRVHLLPNGKVAHVGPEPTSSLYDPATRSWATAGTTSLRRSRPSVATAPVPGEPGTIMICGGRDATASCEKADFTAADPVWRPMAAMNQGRDHADMVVLPDGTVLVIGGGLSGLYSGPILNPERYDPIFDTWTTLPPHQYGRMYHATALLLADGRVLVAGQDDDPADGVVSGNWGEIYEPAYLFKGPRPVIRAAPSTVRYRKGFDLMVASAARIQSVVLMGLSTVTHSVNATQSYVPLDFVQDGGTLRVVGPSHGNVAPPGYHMLFAVDQSGVPSKAAMVRVTGDPTPPATPEDPPTTDPPAGCTLGAGHPRRCTECGPCVAGEGDCDRDAECEAGLVCTDNVGAQFGYAPGIDVCLASSGGGTPAEPAPPGCSLGPGDPRLCMECGPCATGQGDCDDDAECAPGLVCTDNVGVQFGFAPGIDVCLPAGGGEPGACPHPEGHPRYCTDCGPCASGQGDCDSQAECAPGLVCADNVGPDFGFGPAIDVCVVP